MNTKIFKNENKISKSFERLKKYCEDENFSGWDPYDGLNSPFVSKIFGHSKFFRLAWIQLFKKNPINLRPLFLIKKDYNPKGLGLFLTGYCNLFKIEPKDEYLNIITFLADKILSLKSSGFSGDCWGYNFDWQSRLEFMPKFTPTIVATSFVGCALMDAYDCTQKEKYLQSAMSSCEFIRKDLNRTQKENGFIFSYSPLDSMRVHNASFLGSKLLSRAYYYSSLEKYLRLARKSVLACVNAQKEDGSWLFGEDKVQNWIDSFHTGYKLESLHDYQKYTCDHSFDENLKKGELFYLNNFFLNDGTPKYYHNEIFPIDIHCPAQFFASISKLGVFHENSTLARKVMLWTIDNMQNEEDGFFIYQIGRRFRCKTPFIRWGQAWMFYGFSFYLYEIFKNEKKLCS